MKAGFGFGSGITTQPSGFFKREKGSATKKASPFGVTGADGAPAIADETGKTAEEKKHLGVRIADPVIAACVIHIEKTTWPGTAIARYDLTARQPNHHVPTVLIATRPPQYVACNMTAVGAKDLPIVLQATITGDGACAAIYKLIQQQFDKVRGLCGLAASPETVFTARGCPPSVHDNSLLWELPSLDPETCMAKHAAPEEDGILDMLAWAAWTNVGALLAAVPPEILVDCWGVLRGQLVDLQRELETPLHTGIEERLRVLHLKTSHVVPVLEHCIRLRRGYVVGRAVKTLMPESTWPDLGDAAYAGAVRLCLAQQENPVSRPEALLRAAVWLNDAVTFLQDPATYTPVPVTLSEDLPLETIAFAAVVGFYCVRNLGCSPEIGRRVADALCGGPQYLRPRDRTALQQFAAAPFATTLACQRLGWVAKWS